RADAGRAHGCRWPLPGSATWIRDKRRGDGTKGPACGRAVRRRWNLNAVPPGACEGSPMLEGALTRPAAERLIEAAVAAPSAHNSQPWRFVARLDDRVIEIYADPARTLRRGDPR